MIALASPNDPTGELLAPPSSRACSTGCPRAWRCCSTSRSSSSPTRSPTDSSLALLERPPAAARLPQLLQGLGPGGAARRLRARRARLGGAARRARARPRRLRGLPGGGAGGAAQLLGAGRRARAPDRRERVALSAALRERHFEVDRQPGELPVGRPPRRRRRRARRAPGARRRARGRRATRSASPATCARCAIAPAPASARQSALSRRACASQAHAPRADASACSVAQPTASRDWRSSAPVVPSRIFRQALASSLLVVEVRDHLAARASPRCPGRGARRSRGSARIRRRGASSPTRSRAWRSPRAR